MDTETLLNAIMVAAALGPVALAVSRLRDAISERLRGEKVGSGSPESGVVQDLQFAIESGGQSFVVHFHGTPDGPVDADDMKRLVQDALRSLDDRGQLQAAVERQPDQESTSPQGLS
jgi:hypothetical protein